MCWSAKVSYEFACLDTLFVLILLGKKLGVRRRVLSTIRRSTGGGGGGASDKKHKRATSRSVNASAADQSKNGRKRESFAGTYAAMMGCVAIQEWAQYGLWVRGHLQEEDMAMGTQTQTQQHDTIDILLSILTVVGADSIPLTVIISSAFTENSKSHRCTDHRTEIKKHRSQTSTQTKVSSSRWQLSSHNIRRIAQILWIGQAMMLLSTVLYTHQYIVSIGPNHHQQWICETAAFRVGGPVMHAVFYWTYLASGLIGMFSFDDQTMNVNEKRSITAIGMISGIVSFLLYSKTLEACSIWCWSAFTRK